MLLPTARGLRLSSPQRYQAVIDRVQAEGRLPSVVAGTFRDGSLAWVGSAGDPAADATGDPARIQYRIGSITKTFTAVLVLQARDEGLLGLDDPLGRYLPEAAYPDVSIRSLLHHSSGIQAEPVGSWWERSPGVSFDQLARANRGGQVLRTGSAFHYSNLGFAFLGEVVARVRGRDWRTLVTENLTDPLGMHLTTYDPLPGAHARGRSVDHFAGTLTDEPHCDARAMAPAGQLWSTLTDLAIWLDFMAVGRDDILSAATLTEMSSPGIVEDYGLGFRRLAVADSYWVGHTGSMPGFLATAFVDPSLRSGVLALTNATTGVRTDDLARRLVSGQEAYPGEPWEPTGHLPDRARELLGLWFWGNTAHEVRWTNQLLELRVLGTGELFDKFVLEPDQIRGVEGYLLGESLSVERAPDGSVRAWECATFRFTRRPYGEEASEGLGNGAHQEVGDS